MGMKKNNSIGIILGIVFLVIGAGYLAEVFGVIDNFTIFFDGWWTLFIIVPCFCGLFKADGAKVSNLIGLAIGLFLLLMAQDVLDGEKLWALLIAAVCVLIGVNLMFPKKENALKDAPVQADRFDRGPEEAKVHTANANVEHFTDAEIISEGAFTETQNQGADSAEQYRENTQNYENAGDTEKIVCSAVFAGRDIRVDNSYFNGADLSALFGGIDLNLKNALIRKNVTIEVKAMFGGIDIIMPSDVRVVVDITPILGGVDNGTRTPLGADENTPTVFIKGTCLFGGVDVK
jgi:predicted membrane protein